MSVEEKFPSAAAAAAVAATGDTVPEKQSLLAHKSKFVSEGDQDAAAAASASTGPARPLWEQLQERQQAKDEELAARARARFAPPPGLEGTDLEFLSEAEQQERAQLQRQRDAEAAELAKFTKQQAAGQRANAGAALAADQAVRGLFSLEPVAGSKRLRRTAALPVSAAPISKHDDDDDDDDDAAPNAPPAKAARRESVGSTGSAAPAVTSLAAYGSSSSSSSDEE